MRRQLRKRRLELGMTQKQLAALIDVSDSTIGTLETNCNKGSVDVWDNLERVLGVDQKILRQIDKETT